MDQLNRLKTDPIARVLKREHGAARAQAQARRRDADPAERAERMKSSYLAIRPDQGRWLYGLVVATGAKEIVEFGTSFGISTLYLAAGAAETGGRVTGTEFHPEKAGKARANLAEAGLEAEILVGDALETLAGEGAEIDLLFLDGGKDLYLPVLQRLLPRLHRGSVVVADNIPVEREARKSGPTAPFHAFLRDPANGFVSSVAAFAKGGMSFSVKL
ncbi:MAG: methyltransferase [Alteromonadaceae bacterium]|nr:methyltransferase [Alteromonadaceae bacterium]